MASNWTPGPWQVLPAEVDRTYLRVRGTRLGGRYKVCNVLTPYHPGVLEREAAETHANAALIAAAPELYAALAEILDGDMPPMQARLLAERAMAKARGE